MFSKISRYKNLNDIVAADARGRSLQSKRLRLLPQVSGTFLHMLEDVDRLDHLAFKYYKQPRKWWRICDANPEFMSPHALLGKEPIVTTRFPVTYNTNGGTHPPPWAALFKRILQKVGIREVSLEEETELVKEITEYAGKQVEVNAEKFKRVVSITYNNLNLTLEELENAIKDEGFEVDEAENIDRVGKKIIIPPNIVG